MNTKATKSREPYIKKLKRICDCTTSSYIISFGHFCVFLNLGSAPWEALAAVYIAEDLNQGAIIHSIVRVLTTGGAF